MTSPTEDREAKFGGPPPPRSIEQRWVLATQGILTELNTTSHLRVGGEPRPFCSNVSAFRLRSAWGVRNVREARKCLEWLLAEGHRFAYAKDSDASPDDFLGWDLVRASSVAGWSVVAYHLELEEAWNAMVRSARMLRGHFASWAEVGASYALGRAHWSDGSASDITEVTARLLAKDGGWDVAWDVDLSHEIAPPPDDPMPELVVDARGGDGVFRTINEALRSTKASKRVIVRAGLYEESVRIKAPVELVSDGAVTIRTGEGAPLVVDHHAFIRGFDLVAGHNDQQETMQAVWVGDNFLKLSDCTMRTERCAVYAGKDNTNVFIERCRAIEPLIHGVLAQNGANVAILDSSIEAPTGCGVLAEGNGELFLEDVRVRSAVQPSVSFRGKTHAEANGLVVEGAKGNGVEVLGEATASLVRTTVTGSKGTGLLVMSTSESPTGVHESSFTDNAANDVGVIGSRVSVSGSKLGGGTACALAVQKDARVQLEDCSIVPTAQPSMWLMGPSVTVLIECKLENQNEMTVFGTAGTTVRLVSCDVKTAKKQAIVLRGVHGALISDCRIESESGALHIDEGSRVDICDTTLLSRGEGDTPALSAAGPASVVVTGGEIEALGDIAIAAEAGARVRLTRVKLRAPHGIAIAVEQADVRVLGGEVEASVAVRVNGGAISANPAMNGAKPLEIDPARFDPFPVVQGHGDGISMQVEADMVRAGLNAAGLPIDARAAALWIDALVASLALETPLELSHSGEAAEAASESTAELLQIREQILAALRDPERLDELASRLRARVEEVDEEADDTDEDPEEDTEGGLPGIH